MTFPPRRRGAVVVCSVVADSVLVLGEKEETGQVVLHERLGPETHRRADDRRARDQRRQVDPDRPQDRQYRDDPDHDPPSSWRGSSRRFRPVGQAQGGPRHCRGRRLGRGCGFSSRLGADSYSPDGLPDGPGAVAGEHPRHQHNDEDRTAAGEEGPASDVPWPRQFRVRGAIHRSIRSRARRRPTKLQRVKGPSPVFLPTMAVQYSSVPSRWSSSQGSAPCVGVPAPLRLHPRGQRGPALTDRRGHGLFGHACGPDLGGRRPEVLPETSARLACYRPRRDGRRAP